MPLDSVHALVCRELGPNLQGVRYDTIVLPEPALDQVQIRVRAAALNFPDLLMTEGLYQHKPELPYVPGMEGAGEVVACGERVTNFRLGEPVRFSTRSGACADRINVSAARAWPVPAKFSFAQAAAFHVGALTAYVALVRRANLCRGETLLVHGATGGMGLAAVQLGVHLGATVIATGSSEDRLAIARELGASHTIQTAPDGFREAVKSLTAGRGVDVVFDPVGGDVFDESMRVIAWGGRLLVVGFASGRIPSLPVNRALIKGLSVVGVRAGEFGRRNPILGRENELALNKLADAGVLVPHIGAIFPLHQGVEAMRTFAARNVTGKLIIQPNDL